MTKPSRAERLRPAELLVMALLLALFTGLTVWFSTKDIILALIFFGLFFVVALILLSMLLFAITPKNRNRPQK
ncbi:MAG: hypothetical protein WBA28_01505 [Microbacteriaceae bacterium]